MFVKEKPAFSQQDVDPTWKILQCQESRLKRNHLLTTWAPPIATVIFSINILVITINVMRYLLCDVLPLEEYFKVIPFLPKFAAPMYPGEPSKKAFIAQMIWFGYLIPIGMTALAAGGLFVWDYLKARKTPAQPLEGTELSKARAESNLSQNLYQIRKSFKKWNTFIEAGILTLIVSIPSAISVVIAMNKGGENLKIFLLLVILLVSIFVMYWVYMLLYLILTGLIRLCAWEHSEWYYWEQYHRIDAYYEELLLNGKAQEHKD